jgi:hypothetical protein
MCVCTAFKIPLERYADHTQDAAADDAFIETTITALNSAPFPELKRRMDEAEERRHRIKKEKQGKTRTLGHVDKQEVLAETYLAYIRRLGGRAAIAVRNNSIRDAFLPKLSDAHGNSGKIFFTCAPLYEDHLNGSAAEWCTFTARETGIPELQATMRNLSTSDE